MGAKDTTYPKHERTYEFIGFFVPKHSPMKGVLARKYCQPRTFPAETYIEQVGDLVKRHRICLN